VRGACSRFRTITASRQRQQAGRTPNASRGSLSTRTFAACEPIGARQRKDAKTQGFRLLGTFTRWVSHSNLLFSPTSPPLVSLPLGVFALTAVFPPPTRQPDAFAISTGGSRHDPNARSGLVPAYSANISASRANKSACVAASNVPRTTLPASRGRFAILRNPGPMPPAGCSEWLPPRAEDWAWITPGERVACLWHERLGID
jgi:hypothetical protein